MIKFFTIGLTLSTAVIFTSCQKDESVEITPDNSTSSEMSHVSSHAALPDQISFNEHVQPILSEYCYHCHGPDSGTREPKDLPLRLDIEAEAFTLRKGAKHQPIVKGDAKNSDIVIRMRESHDSKFLMPPLKSHKTMQEHEIALIEKWINQGAEYQKHWSFIAPKITEPTELKTISADWAKNPIDQYTAAKMEQQGLTPNEPETASRLLRRLHLDITGLPPHTDEIAAFEKAYKTDADAAVSAEVDRLLKTDGYAEQMARHWLDAARYADTHGIHIDNYRAIWPYRDWVIKAFQKNMRFDKFTIEQIAGDLLPNATLDQKIATGFGRCLPTTGEGGAIAEEYDAIYAQDRTDTTAAIYLGLTMGCAACHDHKFDPLTQKDTYSFNAFFRNTTMYAMDRNKADHPPNIFVPLQADRSTLKKLKQEIKDSDAAIGKRRKEANKEAEAWMVKQSTKPLTTKAVIADISLPLVVKNKQIAGTVDGSPRLWNFTTATQDSPVGKVPKLKNINVDLGDIASFGPKDKISFGGYIRYEGKSNGPIISRMNVDKKYRGWDLWIENGKIATHIVDTWPNKAIKAISNEKLKAKKWVHVAITYDGSLKPNKSVKIYIDGKPAALRYQKSSKLGSIATNVPARLGARSPDSKLSGNVAFHSFQFHRRILEPSEFLDSTRFINQILEIPLAKRSKEQKKTLKNYFFQHVDIKSKQLQSVKKQLAAKQKEIENRGSKSLIMEEKKDSKAIAHILNRGVYSDKLDKVYADVPDVLPPLPEGAPKNRLGLAQWLVTKENPLTARVTMNRFWYYFFGDGIVSSTADFGIMGARPTHPLLLDYLAVEFMDSGWDMQHMVRLITTSATYRQSPTVTPEKKEIDSGNLYLARGPRYRLDAEQIRDLALFSSGLLSQQVGGAPVKPYQPEGVWRAVAMPQSNTRFYQQDTGEKLYRRSLYTFWKRTAPLPSMEILNAPSREVFCVRRDRTNTPLQAFVTLNDVQFVEASRNLAQRALLAEKDFDKRLNFITQSLLSRDFSTEERDIIKKSLDSDLVHYEANIEAAKKLITQGESKTDSSLAAPKLAAWSIVASQVFNMDENLNK